jgi:O-antigen/teichoic acid export membrane protein
MTISLRKRTINGVIWSGVERFSVQGIQFILNIIIARLVAPNEYGLIAMLGIFIAIAQTFIDSGFSNALVQKKERSDIDYSTVFFFNILVSVVIYFFLFIISPYIALFYREPKLEIVSKIIFLNIIISSISIVHRAILTIRLDFKTQARASLFSVVLGGIVGIIFAYTGYEVWALVIQSLLMTFFNTLLLLIYTKWVPHCVFSWKSFNKLFSFGSKLLISGLLHTIYLNLYSLIIGKKYSSTDVGYYNRAYTLAQFPSMSITNVITRVIYPIQCELQNDLQKLNTSFIQYLRFTCFIVFPLMIILAVLSEPFIIVFLSDKWLFSSDLLSILCIAYLLYPIMVINNQILKVRDRTDYFLKAELIKKILALFILIITMPFGLKILCLGLLFYNLLDVIIIIYYTKKVIYTGYFIQIKNVLPNLILAIVMGVGVFLFVKCFENNILKLFLGAFFGFFIYTSLNIIFKTKDFKLIKTLFNNIIK